MHPDFEHSSGQIIERPWLRLQVLPPDNEHIQPGSRIPRVSQTDSARNGW
jgi:hypothetical protein